MRAKKVVLLAVGLVTPLKTTVCEPDGAAELPVLAKRSAELVLASIQPEASPKLVG